MRSALALLFSFLFIVAVGPGCTGGGSSGSSSGGPPSNVGSIIVGVTTNFRVGIDIDRLHVVTRVGGDVTRDEVLTTKSTTSPLELPAEFSFLDLAGGEVVSVELEAFRVGDASTPYVTRLASTKVVINKTLLLRLQIDSRCAVSPGSQAPTCAAPETCIAGVCSGSDVEPKTLPAYTPTWAQVKNDICKPAGGGSPIVVVGEGQADYLPIDDLALAQVEAGPQGGHHIWVAIRVKNLRQSGSITAITGHFPDLGVDVGPFQVIFTFDQDEGGYCKLYGLRFQLDQEQDIQDLLGRVLEVTVKITDKDGEVGVGKRTVTLSKDILM